MKERIITGVVLALVFIGAFALGHQALFLLMATLLGIGGYEIYRTQRGKIAPVMIPVYILAVLIGLFIPETEILAYLSGVMVIYFTLAIFFKWFTFDMVAYSITLTSLLVAAGVGLRNLLFINKWILVYILIAAFATDIFAYFGGRRFGKNKLIPRLSPNKTQEGALIGYAMGVLFSFAYAYFVLAKDLPLELMISASLLMPFFSQIGDLSFSLIKRRYGIKDFGVIFPGHGGVLDRVDSVIFAVLVFNILARIMLG